MSAKKKSEMEKAPFKTFRYVGRRYERGTFYDAFIELDGESFLEVDGDRTNKWKVGRRAARFTIGTVYRIRCTDDFTIWYGSAEVEIKAPEAGEDDLHAWAFIDRGARTERDESNAFKRQEKKARESYGSIIERLQPIYNKLDYVERGAMLRVIGDELRKGSM